MLASLYVEQLKKLFSEDSFTVISPAKGSDEKGSFLGRVRYKKSAGCPLFSLALSWSLDGLIKKHQISLLHVHSGSGGVFLLRKPRCKVVVTAHHTYSQEVKHVYANSVWKKKWKTLMARLEKKTYELADSITCVSADTANALMHDYGIRREKIIVIENPVHVPQYSAIVEKSDNTILFVGRLEPRKGVMTLLHAFKAVHEKIPSARLRLIGANLMGNQLHATIRSLNIQNEVTILGYVADPLRFREMQSATLLAVPSTLEGFGLVAAEAMSLGTLVVASDAPGLKSIITDGHNGLSFPLSDINACAQKLEQALKDEDLRDKLTAQAIHDVSSRFHLETQAKKLHQVFAETLARE